MKKLLYISLFCLCGCQALIPPKPPVTTSENPTNNTAFVIVSVEQSYLGENIGAYNDAWMMYEIATNITDDVTCLMNDYASKKRVKEAIEKACEKDLAIFFFSGHGGREYAWHDKTEVDHYDEYMVLANSSIGDNEMWDLISKSKGRVVLIFNCCHSETMFRHRSIDNNVKFIFPKPAKTKKDSNLTEDVDFKLLCWSGCADDRYSYTKLSGGYFTCAIYNTIKALGKDYSDYSTCWTIIKYSSDAAKVQRPQKTNINKFDETVQVFK